MSITDASTNTRTLAELVAATGLPGNTDLRDRQTLPGLTGLTRGNLLREGILTLDRLAEYDDLPLGDIRNFGPGCLKNVRAVLAQAADQANATA
ncbi:hypothetical protein [Nonomuraea sp. NPDC050786]|uniref:hypothetical protein n=1 Tax=Nonomuraea sp. NPDC050786 TaxID=3154840 RepID=UPI0033EF4000